MVLNSVILMKDPGCLRATKAGILPLGNVLRFTLIGLYDIGTDMSDRISTIVTSGVIRRLRCDLLVMKTSAVRPKRNMDRGTPGSPKFSLIEECMCHSKMLLYVNEQLPCSGHVCNVLHAVILGRRSFSHLTLIRGSQSLQS